MRVFLCLAGIVCLAILAFSVGDVEPTATAQTTVNIAILDSISIHSDSIFVVTGVAAGPAGTTDGCWNAQGYSSTSPAVIGIHTRTINGSQVTSGQRVLTSRLVRGRLSNLVYVASCTDAGGLDYDIYEADVTGP